MDSDIVLLLTFAFSMFNLAVVVIAYMILNRIVDVQKRQRKTSEIHTMAISKIVSIVDSHTATLEDTSADVGEIKQGVTALLNNANAQTKALTKLVS